MPFYLLDLGVQPPTLSTLRMVSESDSDGKVSILWGPTFFLFVLELLHVSWKLLAIN